MPRKQRIRLSPSGRGVQDAGGKVVWRCAWEEVAEIVAWKQDAFTCDVMFRFRLYLTTLNSACFSNDPPLTTMQKSFRRSARNAALIAPVLFVAGACAFPFAGDANLGPAALGLVLWGVGAVYVLIAVHYWMASNRYRTNDQDNSIGTGEQRGFEPVIPAKQDERM